MFPFAGSPEQDGLERDLPGQTRLLRQPQQDRRHAQGQGGQRQAQAEVRLGGPQGPHHGGRRLGHRQGDELGSC